MAKRMSVCQMVMDARNEEKKAQQELEVEDMHKKTIEEFYSNHRFDRNRPHSPIQGQASSARGERLIPTREGANRNRQWSIRMARAERRRRADERNLQPLMGNMECHHRSVENVMRVQAELDLIRLRDIELDREIQELNRRTKDNKRSHAHGASMTSVCRRLESSNQAMAKQLEENRRLQEEIDRLTNECRKTEEIVIELQRDCDELAVQLGETTEVSKTSYPECSLHRTNIDKPKDHLEKTTMAHACDMQKLNFQIADHERTDKFLTGKNKYHVDEGKERRRTSRSQPSIMERGAGSFATQTGRIQSEVVDENLGTVVSNFQEMEANSYMMFQNITVIQEATNEMVTGVEKTQRKMAYLQENKTKTWEATACRTNLVGHADTCKERADKLEEVIRQSDEVIKTYTECLLLVLKNLGYTDEQITELSLVFGRPEERNIHMFLGEVEKTISGLCEMKALAEFKERHAGAMHSPETRPCRLVLPPIVPPVVKESERVEDPARQAVRAGIRSLSVEEVRRRVEADQKARSMQDMARVRYPSRRRSSCIARRRYSRF